MTKKTLAVIASVSCLALATSANAAVFMFNASGTGGDGPESASATINTSPTQITIDLSSLIANPTGAGQLVSGIELMLGSTPGSATFGGGTGTLINIAPGGAVTPDGTTTTHWGDALVGSNLFVATAGTGSAGGSPINLIIGPGPYTNANPSITGRNPSIQNPGHFTINLTGLTGALTVTGVQFEFGTGPDNTLPGVAVPEPAIWALMLFGVGAIGATMRASRRTTLATA